MAAPRDARFIEACAMCDPITAILGATALVAGPKVLKSLSPKAPATSAPVETPASTSAPAPAPAPATNTVIQNAVPQEQSKPIQEAADRERRMRQRRAAAGNTLITGGQGLVGNTPTTGLKTLTGA